MEDRDLDFSTARLGPCRVPSPMAGAGFVGDDERVLYPTRLDELARWTARAEEPPSMEAAGPRAELFFDPATLGCGIVTCGGLCPGLNDVVRAIVLSLHHHTARRRRRATASVSSS
jgi:6-phosphofructokinase 1